MTNPVPGPPPGARPVPAPAPPGGDSAPRPAEDADQLPAQDPTHPEIERAIADLEADLPELPLDQHHARLTAVLEVLDSTLDRARQADSPR
ncbi:hypothetical protein AADG42_12180 [Ammonicoccus fulvus]|uniref:Uncharacterized protein n=1 Tax=Ammonicoccus fulvus TaxID=3138240 RepID=A0ABZ3FTC2_9ACTN